MRANQGQRKFFPAYLGLLQDGSLERRAGAAWSHMKSCDLCPRYCRIDRLRTTRGAVCRTGQRTFVRGFGPHFGEAVDSEKLAATMLALQALQALQAQGCHNIKLVSPSHLVAQIIRALAVAARRGLRLPLVYNTGGYDSPEALALLDGVIDIYMPDMKYADPGVARRHSRVRDYVEVNRAAVVEMHRQVGDLILDEQGLIDLLRERPTSLHNLATMLDLREQDLEGDLRHLIKSLRNLPYDLVVEPARCKKCGFAFRRDKLHKPGKCPLCKGTWIREPVFSVVPSSAAGRGRSGRGPVREH